MAAMMAVTGMMSAGLANAAILPKFVPASELTQNPTKYSGQLIQTVGIMATDASSSGFAPGFEFVDGRVQFKGKPVWLGSFTIEQKPACFTVTNTDKYPITWCVAVISGVFESGGKYGPVAGYDLQIKGGM